MRRLTDMKLLKGQTEEISMTDLRQRPGMKIQKQFAGSLYPVDSRMVAGFYSAVQLRTLAGSGMDEFCFTCPNDECNEHWKSPGSEMWQPTKQLAADKWNAANADLSDRAGRGGRA